MIFSVIFLNCGIFTRLEIRSFRSFRSFKRATGVNPSCRSLLKERQEGFALLRVTKKLSEVNRSYRSLSEERQERMSSLSKE